MFHVMTNKYSHEGSGFTREDSSHKTLMFAIDAANTLWARGHQRFVYVQTDRGTTVYNPACDRKLFVELRVCRPDAYPEGAAAEQMQGYYIRGYYPEALLETRQRFPNENLIVEMFKQMTPDGHWMMMRDDPAIAAQAFLLPKDE